MQIISNKAQSAVIHCTANDSIIVAGNNSVSNLALSSEILSGASIKQIWYGSQGGTWIITRGNSTVNSVVAVLNNTDQVKYSESGTVININKSGNINATLIGTANGYLMMEVSKES